MYSVSTLLRQKDDILRRIEEAERLSKVVDVTEDDIRYHYRKARELFESGQLPEMRQLINLYLERVVVFKEHVEIFIHVLPSFCGVNYEAFENRLARKVETPYFQSIYIARKTLLSL